MKRLINYSSLLVVVTLAWVLATSFSAPPLEARRGFTGFAPGVRTPVRFSAEDLSSLTGTALERRNQLRDWLFYTVLSDAPLDDDALSRVLFDLSPLRTGYTEPASQFEYGRTRSRTIGDGEVVALVPQADQARRLDDLAEIADQAYQTTGVRPSRVRVFEYELEDGDDQAFITQLADVPGTTLFSETYGYVESELRQASDLDQFLSRANDITSARFSAGRLVLGGRKVENGRYRGLTREDVAALWQAERGVREVRREIDDFKARWESRTYRGAAERVALERERDQELAALKLRLKDKTGEARAESTGFSLDPVFDFDRLTALVERSKPMLEAVASKTAGAHSYETIVAALGREDPGPLFDTLNQMRNDPGPGQFISQFLEAALSRTQFQRARYDGALQGTEVGMVLFYTDLLAKLWAMDFERSAPSDRVEDFVPLLKIKVSPIFQREEEEHSNTRLWFGPRDDGYHKTSDGILMGRVATRVYAASSNTLKPGEEAEPNNSSAGFLWWWNNHYDEVASAEREYQRLNEIMKWGLVFGRMDSDELNSLSFLESTKVTRQRWFPEWSRQNRDLTFTAWDTVSFLPQGYRRTTTEALPLLQSRIEDGHSLSGGVSLPSSRVLNQRPALSEATDMLLRRSTVMDETTTGTQRLLKGFDGLTYELKPGASAAERLVTAKPRAAARLRSGDVEIRNDGFQLALTRQSDALSVRMSHGTTRVGEFSVRRVANGFETAFHNHELERARMLLRVVDDATARGIDVPAEIARIPGVARVMPAGKSTFYVKLPSDEARWLQIAPEGQPTVAMGEGVDLRYAAQDGSNGPRWTSRWVDDTAVLKDLKAAEYVRMPAPRDALEGVVAGPATRGPPPGAQRIDVAIGPHRVDAWRAPDGSTYFRSKGAQDVWETADAVRGGIPGHVPPDVAAVRTSMRAGDFDQIARRLALQPKDAPRVLGEYRRVSLDRAKALIKEEKYREAAAELEGVAGLFPDDPELRLTRAMALIGDRRGQGGMNILEAGMGPGGPASPAFDQAVGRMVAGGHYSQRDLGNLATTLRGAELKARLGSGPTKASVLVRPDRTGQLRMEVRLLDWQSAAASPRSLSGGPVYVEVGADFDPAIGIKQSLDALVSEGSPVTRLKNWEVVSASPETIVDAKTGIRYARVGQTAARTNGITRLTRQECQPGATAASTSNCGDEVSLVRRSATGSH